MPLDLPRFGVRLSQALEPRRSLELAAAAEANGFASLWFAENPFHRGIVPVAGACATMTERISIGLGIVNFYQHHPTLIAAEFAALDELAGGRVRLGIGSGIGQRILRLGYKWRLSPRWKTRWRSSGRCCEAKRRTIAVSSSRRRGSASDFAHRGRIRRSMWHRWATVASLCAVELPTG